MSDFILSCCSTADLSDEKFESLNLPYCCFHFTLDGKQYPDDLGKTMSLDDFYAKVVAGAEVSTSQINVDEFCEYFEPFLKEGKDILHLSLSSGISGVHNSAAVAADMMMEKYPDRKVIAIDSLCASSGFGLIMDKLCELRDQGKTLEELVDWTEAHKAECQHWFYCTDLTAFIKGGRVSKTAGFVGGMLNICPLLHVDYEGKLIPMENIRTKKKVAKRTIERMKELAKDGVDYSDKVFISNSHCPEDAQALADLVKENFPKVKSIEIFPIGTTIGCHTGVGTTALFFWGQARHEGEK